MLKEAVRETLLDIYRNHKGRIANKYPHHLEEYHKHFRRYRGTDVCVVEVGVADGGSLELWRSYFGPEAHIVGIDVADRTSLSEEVNADIVIGDQGSHDFWKVFKQAYPKVDIFIDDGSHRFQDQQVTFKEMFPHVQPWGFYACEDIHTSYHEEFGGGYKSGFSFVGLLKELVDTLHWTTYSERGDFDYIKDMIYGVHVYPSLAILEKRPAQTFGGPTMTGKNA